MDNVSGRYSVTLKFVEATDTDGKKEPLSEDEPDTIVVQMVVSPDKNSIKVTHPKLSDEDIFDLTYQK